jgi:hypothetical protein
MPKPKLFISHISTEAELAQLLKQSISTDFLNLVEVFDSSDGTTIRAGSKWLDEVSGALAKAKIEIVLCSHESVRRPWVNFEAGAGWIRGIRVIPVCHLGMRPTDLPVPLSMLQALDASKGSGIRALYEAIAQELDMQAPTSDFEGIAANVEELNRRHNHIENPRILCAASEQWAAMDFELDIALLEKTFPASVKIERKITSLALRKMMTDEHFDIIHLVIAVHPDTGELLFSPVDLKSYESQVGIEDEDRMPPEEFAELVGESQTRLVVLATCNALLLAVEVGRVTNMIGTNIELSGRAIARWAEVFYDFLARGKSLYRAYDLTKASARAPMKLIRHRDVAFAAEPSKK